VSQVIVVPAPTVDYPIDVTWPVEAPTAAGGAAFNASGQTKYGQAISVWSAASGAATNNMGAYHNIYGGQWTCGGAQASGRSATGIPFYLPLTKNLMSAQEVLPEHVRVFRITLCFCAPALVNYTVASGINLAPMAGVAPGFIAAGSPGIGIIGNGAGGWQFATSRGVGLTVTPLVWPVNRDEWCVVDFEMLAATGGSDAIFNLYLNGVQVALPASASKWGAGTALPDYTITPNSVGFALQCAAGDGALAGQLNLGAVRWMQGRYRFGGAQV
jgi:hypothetical protein